jgi:hypothetical protein|tara:strand:- start:62 stop:751 length:690 start_codon:yes stop_codon:yes gene_type:complete
MGTSNSKLDTSEPTPVDKEGRFDVTVSEELKQNMTGTNTASTSSLPHSTETSPIQTNSAYISNNNDDDNNNNNTTYTLKRLPQIPDQQMLQEAYEQGAQDMGGRMEIEVERRVRDQLSLRARIQAANEREAKAQQEYENYETRLNDSLATEDDKAQQLDTYVQALFDRQHSTPTRPLMCTAERTSCLECYQEASKTTTLPIDCASKVDAFVRCADGLREEFVSRGMPSN